LVFHSIQPIPDLSVNLITFEEKYIFLLFCLKKFHEKNTMKHQNLQEKNVSKSGQIYTKELQLAE